jgi:carotenoid cleavage dioxygenase
VIEHAGETLPLVEAGPRPDELTDELDTVGICDFDGALNVGYAAHPPLSETGRHRRPIVYRFISADDHENRLWATRGVASRIGSAALPVRPK